MKTGLLLIHLNIKDKTQTFGIPYCDLRPPLKEGFDIGQNNYVRSRQLAGGVQNVLLLLEMSTQLMCSMVDTWLKLFQSCLEKEAHTLIRMAS